ncbi:MAG TPA: ArsA-related P-loop ATPase [Acidimicrobiales bacterium]|jgi:cellulose biosynthesis protein BcsQ|nr:ArsA-related P-loop ATPase [Acidimicrobiales bacterium]
MDIPAFCAQSSVLVVIGKGGVGKSTVSATLARLAARNTLSVLLVELEGKGGPSEAVGHRALTTDEVEPSCAGTGDRSRSILKRLHPDFDALLVRDLAGGQAAADHLLGLSGH